MTVLDDVAETKASGRLSQGDIAFQANLYEDKNPTRRWLHTSRRAWVCAAIDAYLPTQDRQVLEVGVGAGVFTRYLLSRSCGVLAVDINPTFLAGVADLPGVTVKRADLATLDVHGFDLAVCSEVLEHLPPEKSQAALARLHDALRPGGILILTTPQSYSTVEIVARMFRIPLVLALARKLYGIADELGHTNLLTRRALRRQIRQAGFDIVEETRRGLYIPILAEFCGTAGTSIAASVEALIRDMPVLSGLVWTQCYALRRAAAL
jgi:2-polyprenyl-3-methyl-5-hydroxy-6-metoxy-1,4-benzoquinol methylase